jgi:predicted amidohydrolase
MKIAAAQINSTVGAIQRNLNEHYRMVKIAIENKVQLISFPEMSISGYCLEEGRGHAFTIDDHRLEKLQELANDGNIIIVAGAPIKTKEHLYIGSFVISPRKPIQFYSKQYLHKGEELFYDSSMNHNPIIHLETEKISLAICADINNENHPCQAEKNNCSIYLPSIFYSSDGIDEGCQRLKRYAKKYSLNILMSNYSGELWGMKAGGKSSFWNADGELIDHLNTGDTGILMATRSKDKWSTKKLVAIMHEGH